MSHQEGPVEQTGLSPKLEEAAADLAALRAALVEARTDRSADVIDLARQYWRKHGPTLRLVFALVLERARSDLLSQLYDLRRQLAEQLRAQSTMAGRNGST